MPPACQDVTVFPHRLHLRACTCVCEEEREVVVVVLVVVGVSWCHNRLTSFIYNYAGARVCV